MSLLLDSFWRAAAYCLRPRIMLLSLMPLVLVIGATVGLSYLLWDPAMDMVRQWLMAEPFVNVWAWLDSMGLAGVKIYLAPLIFVFVMTPLIVVVCLLAVAFLMAPVLVRLVAMRRFPQLQQWEGASFLASLGWSLGSALIALLALIVSLPLWLVPPLALVLPPLIWGWLSYRVMAFDALAVHASKDERRAIFQRHRIPLLLMGVCTGYLGGAPSLLWVLVGGSAEVFIFLAPLVIWIYTLVFVFCSLWFAHYCLAALYDLRSRSMAVDVNIGEPQAVVQP